MTRNQLAAAQLRAAMLLVYAGLTREIPERVWEFIKPMRPGETAHLANWLDAAEENSVLAQKYVQAILGEEETVA